MPCCWPGAFDGFCVVWYRVYYYYYYHYYHFNSVVIWYNSHSHSFFGQSGVCLVSSVSIFSAVFFVRARAPALRWLWLFEVLPLRRDVSLGLNWIGLDWIGQPGGLFKVYLCVVACVRACCSHILQQTWVVHSF